MLDGKILFHYASWPITSVLAIEDKYWCKLSVYQVSANKVFGKPDLFTIKFAYNFSCAGQRFWSKYIKIWCKDLKVSIHLLLNAPPQQICTCSKSTIETLEKGGIVQSII